MKKKKKITTIEDLSLQMDKRFDDFAMLVNRGFQHAEDQFQDMHKDIESEIVNFLKKEKRVWWIGKLSGRVIIQTYNPENYSIVSASKHNYIEFYEQEIKIREKLMYPPFSNIGVIIVSGLHDKNTFIICKKKTFLLFRSLFLLP